MTTIRSVAETDYAQWRPLWDGYNKFYGRFDATALPEVITAQTWKRFFDETEPAHCLVAKRDGKIVGIVHYLFHHSTVLKNDICYLQDLFADETVRGNGIGRALIEAVYDKARAAGSERVYWQTHETNARAMALYNQVADRSGFLVYRKQI